MGVSFTKNKLSPEERERRNKTLQEELFEEYEIPVEDDLLEAIANDHMKRESIRSADVLSSPLSPHLLSHNSSFVGSSSCRDLFVYGGPSGSRKSSYGVDLHSDEPAVDIPLSMPPTRGGPASKSKVCTQHTLGGVI